MNSETRATHIIDLEDSRKLLPVVLSDQVQLRLQSISVGAFAAFFLAYGFGATFLTIVVAPGLLKEIPFGYVAMMFGIILVVLFAAYAGIAAWRRIGAWLKVPVIGIFWVFVAYSSWRRLAGEEEWVQYLGRAFLVLFNVFLGAAVIYVVRARRSIARQSGATKRVLQSSLDARSPVDKESARWHALGIAPMETHLSSERGLARTLFVLSGPMGLAIVAGLFAPTALVAIAMAKAMMGAANSAALDDLLKWMLAMVALVPLLFARRLLRRFARRLIQIEARELLKRDERRPVVFLRAFEDDQVSIMTGTRFSRALLWWKDEQTISVDHLATELLWPMGPVIALGNPAQPIPDYGAVRYSGASDDWRSIVGALCARAAAIVLCVDSSAGVAWEMEHLRSESLDSKTLFLIPPKLRNVASSSFPFRAYLKGLGFNPESQFQWTNLIGWFSNDKHELVVLVSRASDEITYRIALTLFRNDMHPNFRDSQNAQSVVLQAMGSSQAGDCSDDSPDR